MYRSRLGTGLVAGILTLAACDGAENLVDTTPKLDRIEITSEDSRTQIAVNEALRLTAQGKDQQGNPFGMSGAISWSSDNTAVADVDQGGNVTGRGRGSASIRATADGKTASFAITVQGAIHASDITASETWRAVDNPHLVRGAIGVAGSGTPVLTIEPGVDVRFNANASLTIGSGGQAASLKAAGTAASPIRFAADAASPQKGHWSGLIIRETASAVEIRNATFSHCGGASGWTSGNACILSFANGVVAENVTVENSAAYGVLFDDGAFGAGSTRLNITGSNSFAAQIRANDAGTFPTGGTISGNTRDAIEIAGETVSTAQTWANHGVPYVLSGDVEVSGAGTPVLTIPAGVQLRVAAGSGITIGSGASGGGLKVLGTTAAPVQIVADAATPAKGFWTGIIVRETAAGQVELRNATLSHCGGSSGWSSGNACVISFGRDVTVENLTIDNSGAYGVLFDDGSFRAGSTRLSITGSNSFAAQIQANEASTFPTGGTISGNTINAVEIEGETVTTTQTWPNLGVPYVLSGDVEIYGPGTPVLTIPAGVTLRVASNLGITVGSGGNAGGLTVQGSAAAPVTFTADAAAPTPGFWTGIIVRENAQVSIGNAVIEFGGGVSGWTSGDANILAFSPFTLTSSVIRQSRSCGVLFDLTSTGMAPPDVTTGNTFTANAAGDVCVR
ncbi:MAG TPA: Ig-like domain-containing protein [Longimicrobiales bacterium]|nr:Ig-like domain-containing protein [Longimicrobiales bacterium]